MVYWSQTVNKESLEQVDKEKVESWRREQQKLLGGELEVYQKVDNSLRKLKVDQTVEKEQKLLFSWREKFFREHFKTHYHNDKFTNWITHGNDDAHSLDTVDYQVACNFEEVLKLAATERNLDLFNDRKGLCEERFYFKSDEIKSAQARRNFSDFYDDCSDITSEEEEDKDCDTGTEDEDESPPEKKTNWLEKNLVGMFDRKVNLKDDEDEDVEEVSNNKFRGNVEKLHRDTGWAGGRSKNSLAEVKKTSKQRKNFWKLAGKWQ
eukprot:GFUD01042105.1.p1 GENE.GFUD01042105.1~~GFUD01042105.1.p1  ORF type:complete len:299 (+),score=96.71 GFUD01042105.1:107-898(+)